MQNTNESTGYLVKRLLREHVFEHKVKIFYAVLCMIIVAATTASQAWLMEPVMDKVFINSDKSMLLIVPVAVFITSIMKGFASYGQSFIMKSVGQTIVTKMQMKLYKHLIYADIKMFSDNNSGNLISRFTNDIMMMRRSVTNLLTGVAKDFFTLIFLISLMFYQNAMLALIAFTIFPVAIYPIIRLGKRMRKISNQTQHKLGDFTVHLDETFQGIKVVKSYNREQYENDKAASVIDNLLQLYIKAARTESAVSPIMETLGGIVIASVIWYGGLQVLENETTPGAFFSFITALLLAYKPMKSIAGLNTALQEGLAAAKRFFYVIDNKHQITDIENATSLVLNGGNIEIKNISFSYNNNSKVLDDVTINLQAGKTIALVGSSGSGKTTIANLLMRFYDVDSGTIVIDGQDIKNVKQNDLRENIAIVGQESILFDDTIMNNIRYGKLEASDEDVIEAAKLAYASEFIEQLDDGYNTQIGQHGAKLSGGQKQRIAIARAIIKNAPILLLDEATSALDNISEQKIQFALDNFMKNRTTLVIAHRISTIVNADAIYVIEKGKVIENGTHNELLANGDKYNELYKKMQ